MTVPIAFPVVDKVTVRPSTVDEWYGVDVNVRWKEKFDYHGFLHAVREEEDRWFAEHPREMHVGPWPLMRTFVDRALVQVLAHPAWERFYAEPRTVTCEEYEDGPERRIQIPRFRASDFSDWEFTEWEGWFHASTR